MLFAVVDQALEILGLDALDRARQQFDAARFAHAGAIGRSARRSAAAHREFLARVGKVALEPLALFHQRGDAPRHLLDRGAQLACRVPGELHGVVGVLARMASGQRLDAADAGGNRALAGH